MTAWRLVRAEHARNAFDGEGARLYGGRWNTPGTRVAYASRTPSLAVLEVLVRLQSAAPLRQFSLCRIHLDPSLIETLDPSHLPKDWKAELAPRSLQAIGDRWIALGEALALAVPSVVVPEETNLLINPKHPAFASVKIDRPVPFRFDPRLIRARSDRRLRGLSSRAFV